ncbi:hypothetical protein GIB67_016838 [Kingdonia uniflora]|uniref:Uncharacterized protein n=1 Tax=Kingdonia uniflora TaxID=39325 RepID=A0A7J7LQH9_9MAGN|nr:hypothetical protein GIB67_016838 [Kingdonia uniflora]
MCFRDLSSNALTGDLPKSFSSLTSVNNIYLQSNQFTGTIVVFENLPLQNLNVANNCFSGWIPGNLKEINNLQTDGNSWSTGPAPPPPPFTPPPGKTSPNKQPATNSNPSGANGGSKKICPENQWPLEDQGQHFVPQGDPLLS